MKKFELFLGCFGNGTIACNKAVYENGDYKQVAHISPAGNIKLYVKPDYIPVDDMKTIEKVAKRNRKETIKQLERMLNIESYDFNTNYFRILDKISRYCHFTDTFALLDRLNNKEVPEKVEIIKEFCLLNF